MKIIKNVLLLCLCVLIVIFQPLATKKEEDSLSSAQKERDDFINEIIDNIISTTEKANGSPKLYGIDIIRQMVTDEQIVDRIKSYTIKGCFKIGDGKIEYQDVYCDRYVFDESISSNPILLDRMIPVFYNKGKLSKTNLYDWYNYDKNVRHFAYAVTTARFFYENKRIYDGDYEDLYIWIPAFYYNEDNNTISLKEPGDVVDKVYKYTTSNHLLNAFMYKNSELYGFWVQLTIGEPYKLKSKVQENVHKITEDEKFAIKMFEKYYTIDNYFSNLDGHNVISVGKETFFDE